ncbi:MAG TPA: sulfotransferase [Rhizomicrobium sp.]|jgi:hypothetical protein|nr:sulfotransferase [Rhizomicrobium sp.]
MIFIFSSARSGSTWVAKAFDSHPDTLYLHEPDIVDRGSDLLPHWFDGDASGCEERARQYLSRLAQNRNLRTVGTRPIFRKTYRSDIAWKIRIGLIYAGKGLERAGLTAMAERIEIPDMARAGFTPRLVVKSVSALGRIEALVKSAVPMSPILLLRNPCAFVQSYLRGNRMGVMRAPGRMGRLLQTRSARRLNVDAALDKTEDPVERLAWEWLLANCEANDAIAQAGGIVVKYEDVAASPEKELRSLFSRLGLDWPDSTTQFLQTSSAGEGSYYSLTRDPLVAISRWKQEMPQAHIEKVQDIVSRAPVGRQYFS